MSLMPQKRWITTEIEINAPSAVVWKVLTDFPGYGSWNPFIRQIEGKLIVGKRLRVFARLPCGLPMVLWPKVLGFGIEQEMRWLGSLLVSGLLDGEHLFMLNPLGEAPKSDLFKERRIAGYCCRSCGPGSGGRVSKPSG